MCWSCRSVGSYRNESLSHATFSHDGSVLGVVAEDAITLWQAESNMLLGVLATQPQCKTIAGMCFVAESPNLVAICKVRHCTASKVKKEPAQSRDHTDVQFASFRVLKIQLLCGTY